MDMILNMIINLRSNPKEVHWRNRAQWYRNTLLREGLLKSDSPRGIWEISNGVGKCLRVSHTLVWK